MSLYVIIIHQDVYPCICHVYGTSASTTYTRIYIIIITIKLIIKNNNNNNDNNSNNTNNNNNIHRYYIYMYIYIYTYTYVHIGPVFREVPVRLCRTNLVSRKLGKHRHTQMKCLYDSMCIIISNYLWQPEQKIEQLET